jgi:GTP cyclohydrolase I
LSGPHPTTGTAAPAESCVIDKERIAAAVREILDAIGEDPTREGLRRTPLRVAEMYAELFAGLAMDPQEILRTSFEERHEDLVVLRDIPFHSLCEHHLLPFFGRVHVGYIPNGRVAGLSKIARVVDAFAWRPQLQERLTGQVADCILETLRPDGMAVVVEAEHLCLSLRGVKKPGTRVVTSAVRGQFERSAATRSEFLCLVQGK